MVHGPPSETMIFLNLRRPIVAHKECDHLSEAKTFTERSFVVQTIEIVNTVLTSPVLKVYYCNFSVLFVVCSLSPTVVMSFLLITACRCMCLRVRVCVCVRVRVCVSCV